eukprot:6211725-Pleurochrysis_carterae.AAC.1
MRVAHTAWPEGPRDDATPGRPAPGDCPLHPTAANHRRRFVSIPSDTDSPLLPCPPATVVLRCYM